MRLSSVRWYVAVIVLCYWNLADVRCAVGLLDRREEPHRGPRMDGSEPDSPDLHLDAANPAFLQNIEHEVDGLMTSRADESTCVYVRNHSRVEMNVYFYCGVTYVVSGERPGIVLNFK